MPVDPEIPIIGQSEQTRALKVLIRTLAASGSTVLITGESGTGKELVANALHEHSPRRKNRFVPINCGAIPRDLLESELFGHCKGAFTGAISDRIGRFELASGGTLFLDEVGDLPLDMQVKLLRVLQEGCIQPVGSTRSISVDARIIAATHRNLEHEVQQARFREDLYYRLNVLPCHTTPLRERRRDIPDLLYHYAERHARHDQAPIRYGSALLEALQRYAWPGNVRELSNLVDRFTTLFPGQCVDLQQIPTQMLPRGLQDLQTESVQPEWLAFTAPSEQPLPIGAYQDGDTVIATTPNPRALPVIDDDLDGEPNEVEEIVCMAQGMISLPTEGVPLKQHLVQIERSLIEQALQRCGGNVSQTARLLHLQRTTLIEKINKYGLRFN